MKIFNQGIIVLTTLLMTLAVSPAADEKAKEAPAKSYPLKTCVVTDEKLGGDHGDPYVFTHEGREVKLCCKSCLKDFKKDTAKYIKKMEEGDKTKK